jgi:hypothetical protein
MQSVCCWLDAVVSNLLEEVQNCSARKFQGNCEKKEGIDMDEEFLKKEKRLKQLQGVSQDPHAVVRHWISMIGKGY